MDHNTLPRFVPSALPSADDLLPFCRGLRSGAGAWSIAMTAPWDRVCTLLARMPEVGDQPVECASGDYGYEGWSYSDRPELTPLAEVVRESLELGDACNWLSICEALRGPRAATATVEILSGGYGEGGWSDSVVNQPLEEVVREALGTILPEPTRRP